MFAVIKTGGKQYRVKEGDLLDVEKLDAPLGQKLDFDQVLLIEDTGKILIGTPIVEHAAVRAEVVENFKGDKVLVFKKKRRKQYRRTHGHRQQLTKVRIEKIYPDTTLVAPEELKIEPVAVKPVVPKPAAPVKKAVKAPKPAAPAPKKAAKPAAAKAPAKKAAPVKKAPAKPVAKAKKAPKA
jgi:large subunit ribosomal protein L21